jgi:hypothetical protein
MVGRMSGYSANPAGGPSRCAALRAVCSLALVFALLAGMPHVALGEARSKVPADKDAPGEFSWELPGRVSIYDLQFGPAVLKDKKWEFLGNVRSFSAGEYKERLTLMVQFSYKGSKADIPIKFIIKLPGARQYEETVHLTKREGRYSYQFTIHNPENFIGSGSVYLYYGFSMVDVLPFTVMPGS